MFSVGDKVQIMSVEEGNVDRGYNGVYPKEGIVLSSMNSSDDYLIGVTDPPYFTGHCGNENERQLFNWHEKCWWIYKRYLRKVG